MFLIRIGIFPRGQKIFPGAPRAGYPRVFSFPKPRGPAERLPKHSLWVLDSFYNDIRFEIRRSGSDMFDRGSSNRPKFDVVNNVQRHIKSSPSVHDRKRRLSSTLQSVPTTLHKSTKNQNTFSDRRFGENDNDLSLEDKIMSRFTSEKRRKMKKSSLFNLNDDTFASNHTSKFCINDGDGDNIDAIDIYDERTKMINKNDSKNRNRNNGMTKLHEIIQRDKANKVERKEEKEEQEKGRMLLDHSFEELLRNRSLQLEDDNNRTTTDHNEEENTKSNGSNCTNTTFSIKNSKSKQSYSRESNNRKSIDFNRSQKSYDQLLVSILYEKDTNAKKLNQSKRLLILNIDDYKEMEAKLLEEQKQENGMEIPPVMPYSIPYPKSFNEFRSMVDRYTRTPRDYFTLLHRIMHFHCDFHSKEVTHSNSCEAFLQLLLEEYIYHGDQLESLSTFTMPSSFSSNMISMHIVIKILNMHILRLFIDHIYRRSSFTALHGIIAYFSKLFKSFQEDDDSNNRQGNIEIEEDFLIKECSKIQKLSYGQCLFLKLMTETKFFCIDSEKNDFNVLINIFLHNILVNSPSMTEQMSKVNVSAFYSIWSDLNISYEKLQGITTTEQTIKSRIPLQWRRVIATQTTSNSLPQYELHYLMKKGGHLKDDGLTKLKQLRNLKKRELSKVRRDLKSDSDVIDHQKSIHSDRKTKARRGIRTKNYAAMEQQQAIVNLQARRGGLLKGGGSGGITKK